MSSPLQLNLTTFLGEYWQQQPLLIKQGWPEFTDPLAPELLAGLALEEGVDSRVIEQRQQQWLVTHGPFEDYEAFGEEDWTLLVQSVNEWFPEVQQLLEPFRFLPDWRTDDVMISFAVPGGSVGPHLDQYDVFIIQGLGRRHWQVGNRLQDATEHRPHPDLKQLQQSFTPCIDAVLETGDILYIPAGCPHHGVALEPSLNYSIGFRAPNTAELTAQVADMLLATEQQFPRYQDPHAESYGPAWQVSAEQLTHLKQFLLDHLRGDSQLDTALLQVMSQSKRPLPQPDHEIEAAELLAYSGTDMLLCRTPGARILLGPDAVMYANGESYGVNSEVVEFAEQLAALWQDQPLCELSQLSQPAATQLLCDLLNTGVFHLVQEAD